MATWQDGPEYAPLVPPADFEPAAASTPAPTNPAPANPRSTDGPLPPPLPPSFAAPESPLPLEAVRSDRSEHRDPRVPFDIVARTHHSGSAWPAAHASAGAVPASPLPDVPAAIEPPPYVPAPPVADTPQPDLVARERAARWLLAPALLNLVGALNGPLVILTVIISSILLVTQHGIRRAARTVSQIAFIVVAGAVLASLLAGEGLAAVAGLARGVGMVHAVLCGLWFVRERSEIDAERDRRARAAAWSPPPQDGR